MYTLNCDTGSEFQSSECSTTNKEKRGKKERKVKGAYQLIQKASEKIFNKD